MFGNIMLIPQFRSTCTETKAVDDDENYIPLSSRISHVSNLLKQEQFAEAAAIAELAKSTAARWWEHSAADPKNIYAYGANGLQVPKTPSGAVHAVCTCLYAFC